MLNPLGTFTWNYTGTDPRPGSITHSGGFNTEFKYATLANGGRLTELISKLPGGATIAKHSYTHDTLGQIATWKREAPLANPGTTHQYEWTLAHDFSGQLTSVIEKDLTGGLRDSWAMNPRANQWHGMCQPMEKFVPFLLLGYEPRFDHIQRNVNRPMPETMLAIFIPPFTGL